MAGRESRIEAWASVRKCPLAAVRHRRFSARAAALLGRRQWLIVVSVPSRKWSVSEPMMFDEPS
jgi:hypothetical protein